MNELNWVKKLNESYLKEIAAASDNMSVYMSNLKQKLIKLVPNGEPHVESFVQEHIVPNMTEVHHARINGAGSNELDNFSSHTADKHKIKFFQYVIGKSGNDEEEK